MPMPKGLRASYVASFVDEGGRDRVAYTDLFVTDAQGKTVPAWLSVDAKEIAIVVDDAEAVYPLNIDPLVETEQAKLLASDGAAGRAFGVSVSLLGDTALVGVPGDDENAEGSRSVYLFVVTPNANGEACTNAVECASGFCVDGVCCDQACGNGDAADCQACAAAAGATMNGVCAPLAAGTECRASAGVCDAAETCDGTAIDCPTDVPSPDDTACPVGVCKAGVCSEQMPTKPVPEDDGCQCSIPGRSSSGLQADIQAKAEALAAEIKDGA